MVEISERILTQVGIGGREAGRAVMADAMTAADDEPISLDD